MGKFKIVAKTAAKAAKKVSNRTLFAILIIILVATLATTASIVFLVIKPTLDNVNNISNDLGESIGQSVALAMEPFHLPEDIVKGLLEGREEGLSAEDTVVIAEVPIESLGSGKMEVFESDIIVQNVDKRGDDLITGPTYAALYMCEGKIVFTVDLNDVKIKYLDNEIKITIPSPTPELKWYGNGVIVKDEYQSVVGGVISKPDDSIIASLNSEAEIYEQTPDKLDDFPVLKAMAEDAAITQIETFAKTVILSDKTINVEIQGDK